MPIGCPDPGGGVGGHQRATSGAAQNKQRRCYGGKQRRHTLKMQLSVQAGCKRVIAVAVGPGRRHDLKLLKPSQTRVARLVRVKADKGYQGLRDWHASSQTPHKTPPRRQLSPDQRRENRQLARERIVVEHVNRRFKVFRILGELYRNRRRRFELRVNLIAGMYNLDLPS